MNIIDLQSAVGVKPDGIWGQKSRDALLLTFTNPTAPELTQTEIAGFADRLGVSEKQLQAVAKVEASGKGFDNQGRPKILYERHKFHKYTGGRWSVSAFSNPVGGGYQESSWDKLLGAIITGAVDAAFMSCSWGKFQVLGEWWDEFGFSSPFAFAHSTVASESKHYELLVDYVEFAHLKDEMAMISTDSQSCRAFAKGYNGGGYEKLSYHTKLADAMK
ncbi:N-acetylmuramidase domain-containing protein [Novosphingobium sp. BL-8A]|uniref:N-acetylmuramidase domain-containing protein n=1 Tax=Novosphingobium sp. BL-8A TaxID=3127639 RepID=UPI003756CD0E